VNWTSPPGKAIFYNYRLGKLFVKATAADLDKIERTISQWMPPAPQIHIKARFVEVPKGTMSTLSQFQNVTNLSFAGGYTGILNDENFKTVIHALEAREDVEFLTEPEVTTASGRQTQVRATQTQSVLTKFVYQKGATGTNAIQPQVEKVTTGPILDVAPHVLADGYTINLSVEASFTQFLGYDTPTNTVTLNTSWGKALAPKILPHFHIQRTSANLNLWDGQTVVLGGLPVTNSVGGIETAEKSNTIKNDLLVFVTATLVDPAGNRIHTDTEMPFAQTGIPPQPAQNESHVNDKALPGYYDGGNPNQQIQKLKQYLKLRE
jgi:type II secretory pathway component GspD/PulD (secretin)